MLLLVASLLCQSRMMHIEVVGMKRKGAGSEGCIVHTNLTLKCLASSRMRAPVVSSTIASVENQCGQNDNAIAIIPSEKGIDFCFVCEPHCNITEVAEICIVDIVNMESLQVHLICDGMLVLQVQWEG